MERPEWQPYDERVQHLNKAQARALAQECHTRLVTYGAAFEGWQQSPFLTDVYQMEQAAHRRAHRLEDEERRAYFERVRERMADDAKFAEWKDRHAWREVPWHQARLDQMAQVAIRMPKDSYEFSMWRDQDTWFSDFSDQVCMVCGQAASEAGALMTHSRTLETRCDACRGYTKTGKRDPAYRGE